MASFPPVEAVVRTLRVLEVLNCYPVVGIAQLHRQTGIPKPSLVRLLQTLAAEGYVRNEPRRGYMLTSKVRALASGFHSEPRIVEVLAPLMDALTAEVKWPVALAVPDSDAAVIRYSTVPRSPLALLHSSIDMRLSLVTRALGLAYLAFCEPDEREILIGMALRSLGDAENAIAHQRESLDATLELIRRRGYALRHPKVRPVSNTLAVPVFDGQRAVGAIGLTWFASTMPASEAVERYLQPLQDVAQRAREALVGGSGVASGVPLTPALSPEGRGR